MITLQQAQELRDYVYKASGIMDSASDGRVNLIADDLVVALTPKPKAKPVPPVSTGMFRAYRARTIFRGIEGLEQKIDLYFQQKYGEHEIEARFAGSPAHAVLMGPRAKPTGQGRVDFDTMVKEYVTSLTDQDIAALRLEVTNRNSK